VRLFEGEVLPNNHVMLALARKLCFDIRAHPAEARLLLIGRTLSGIGGAECRRLPATKTAERYALAAD
jgi:hypothetical protein